MRRITIFFVMICACISALSQTSIWTGGKTKWTKGIGTISDPFLIENADNLAYLSDGGSYEGKYFRLIVDLDLQGIVWTPIGGFEDAPFKGNINFNGHIISGLNVGTERGAGLFGYIENANICNIVFDNNCITKGYNIAGMFVGQAKNSRIDNVINYGKVFSDGYLAYTGGIIGYAMQSIITNAMNCGEIENLDKSSGSTDPVVYVGGIVGFGSSTTIQQCCNNGFIHGYSVMATAIYNVGGIVGNCDGIVSYCYNTGKVQCRLREVRWYNGGTEAYVAGICGGTSNKATISNCYNTGNISGSSYWSGDYACICSVKTSTNCFSTWDITGCSATSYTSRLEYRNGTKVSMEELNTSLLISKLNDGADIFIKDQYPYVNNSLPVFSTIKQISIKTEKPTEITADGATLNGAVFAPGYDIKQQGFLIKPKGTFLYDTILVNTYYEHIENLLPDKKYVYRFFVVLEDSGIVLAEEEEFKTTSITSEIYTLDYSNVSSNSVDIKGAVIVNDSEVIIDYGFEYWVDGTTSISKVKPNSFDGTYFYANLTGLYPMCTYRYRSYAQFNIGYIYGDENSFTTLDNTTGFDNQILVEQQKSMYSLTGQRITTPTKGVYIINGKKTIK